MLLLAFTISGLRALLHTCENYLNEVDMCSNANKSQCIRFGRIHIHTALYLPLAPVGDINWVDCCRYLGVFFMFPAFQRNKVEYIMPFHFRPLWFHGLLGRPKHLFTPPVSVYCKTEWMTRFFFAVFFHDVDPILSRVYSRWTWQYINI